jgi:hypothetical protein
MHVESRVQRAHSNPCIGILVGIQPRYPATHPLRRTHAKGSALLSSAVVTIALEIADTATRQGCMLFAFLKSDCSVTVVILSLCHVLVCLIIVIATHTLLPAYILETTAIVNNCAAGTVSTFSV